MIGLIRRRLLKSTDIDRWDTSQVLAPEPEATPEVAPATPVYTSTPATPPGYSPEACSLTDYYKGVVSSALENGGMYGGHHIPISWLRLILAGLEGRPIEPEAMWYAADPGAQPNQQSGVPTFEDLFPSDHYDLSKLR